jgi:hypothetical protein
MVKDGGGKYKNSSFRRIRRLGGISSNRRARTAHLISLPTGAALVVGASKFTVESKFILLKENIKTHPIP